MVLASDREGGWAWEGGPTGLDTNRVMGGHYYWPPLKVGPWRGLVSYEGFSLENWGNLFLLEVLIRTAGRRKGE